VIGLGLVGGTLWWAGKMLGEVGESEEDILASLPSSVPKMLAAPREELEGDVIEGEVVGDADEE